MEYKRAEEIVNKYITDPKTKYHLIESEVIMRGVAKELNEDEDKYGIVGLLHDIDWDMTKDDIKNHTILAEDILKKEEVPEDIIEAVVSHTWGNTDCGKHPNKKRETNIEFSLIASETLTGIIFAYALMQPDKKVSSIKLKGLKKKFKDKAFARNCDRNLILEIENTGITLERFLEIGLKEMSKIEDQIGLN